MSLIRPLFRPLFRPLMRPLFPGESWTPLSLFSNGEQGAFYLPEPENLFQDAAGTTPVTADGDPVGLMLDKSGNGNHASQANSLRRPIYRTDGVLHWLEGDGVDDAFLIPGSVASLSFLTDGTGATILMSFDKNWISNPSNILAGSTFYAGAASGIDIFLSHDGTRNYRYRHVNPSDGLFDSALLDGAVNLTGPTIFEYRQDSGGQVWSTPYIEASAPLTIESPVNDFRVFAIPGASGPTSTNLISPGLLKFYGGIMVSKKVDDLSTPRRYLAAKSGVQI